VPIRAVLFDATGTLIELRESVGESYARFAESHGVRLPAWRLADGFARIVAGRPPRVFPGARPDEVAALERSWWRDVVRDTFRATDQTVSFDDFEAFFAEVFGWYATAEAWRLREGVADALAALAARGLRQGVLSDFDYRLTEVLESLGIASFFETVTLAGAVGASKPDPQIFAAALETFGLPTGEVVYVGDDPDRDLEGARRAGLPAIDVTSLASVAELPDHLATVSSAAPSFSPSSGSATDPADTPQT
jgi:putative hydrolase of the HAD superfamily